MSGRKVNHEQAREHERRAWEMRQKGATLERIAAELKLSPAGVCKILQRVSARVQGGTDEDVKRWKAEQRARLEWIADEAAQAWEKSKQNAQTVRREKVTNARQTGEGESEEAEKVTMTIEGQCGDTAYLEEVRAALADLRKLDGLNEPEKTESKVTFDGLTDEERRAGLRHLLGIPGDSAPGAEGGAGPAAVQPAATA